MENRARLTDREIELLVDAMIKRLRWQREAEELREAKRYRRRMVARKPKLSTAQDSIGFSLHGVRMKLHERNVEDLHQLVQAESGDRGFTCHIANRLYAAHVRLLVLPIRVHRRWMH